MALSAATAVKRELTKLEKRRNSLNKEMAKLDAKIKSRRQALIALEAPPAAGGQA